MENLDHISESLETIFWLKYLNSLICIRDPGPGMEKIQIWDQGSRMETIWIHILDPGWETFGFGIRDKHPRSAKLEILSPNLLGLTEPNNNGTLCGKGILG
jgi:hypothetical protein